MNYNMLRFGNVYYRQKYGTSIGAHPGCDWAMQMFAFFEMTVAGLLFQNMIVADFRFTYEKIGIFEDDRNNSLELYKYYLSKVCELEWATGPLSDWAIFLI